MLMLEQEAQSDIENVGSPTHALADDEVDASALVNVGPPTHALAYGEVEGSALVSVSPLTSTVTEEAAEADEPRNHSEGAQTNVMPPAQAVRETDGEETMPEQGNPAQILKDYGDFGGSSKKKGEGGDSVTALSEKGCTECGGSKTSD